MKRLLLAGALLLALPLPPACAQGRAPHPLFTIIPARSLTNRSVIDLTAKGLPADSIIARIAASPGAFDVSDNSLQVLRQSKVNEAVLRALLAKAGKATIKIPTGPTAAEIAMLTAPNCPYVRDRKTGKWLPLEKTTYKLLSSLVGMPAPGNLSSSNFKLLVRLPNDKSVSRQSATDSVIVLLNTFGQEMPYFAFYPATIENGARTAICPMVTQYASGFTLTSYIGFFKISFPANGIVRLACSKKLPPGEYFFAVEPKNVNSYQALNYYTGTAYGLGID